ncbi:MAG: cysteine desulfurase [Rhodothermales bacterium]|nr:cysteine desulfurase [Rhodothermales bacterium]
MPPIYLDYAASSPIPPEVREAMLPWFDQGFGNPSSVHASGRRARNAVEESRETLAGLLGVEPASLIFTSGGTESDYLAITGYQGDGPRITSRAEHAAVLETVRLHEQGGGSVALLETDQAGRPTMTDLADQLAPGGLVSLMWVNNELGSINPVAEVAGLCHAAGCGLHCDAIQGPAWTNLELPALGADLVSLSAHKVGGPKGVGLLYVAPGTAHSPVVPGGGQEQGRRGGTENVPGIVGFARAMELLYADPGRTQRLAALSTQLRHALTAELGGEILNNSPESASAPHIVHISVPGIPSGPGAEMLILGLDLEGVEVSAGSACASGALSAGHVLEAIGREELASIRFSLGYGTTETDIETAADAAARVIRRVRESL